MGYIERLLGAQVQPEDLCFTSFTKAAVNEARERVQSRFGLFRDRLPFFGTLHSLAYRRLGLNRSNVFGRKQWKEFCEGVSLPFTDVGGQADDDLLEPLGTEEGDVLRRFYDWRRNCLLPIDAALHTFDPGGADWIPSRAHWFEREVEAFKTEQGLYDFVDMLTEVDAEEWVPGCRVLIGDECQDLSPLQQRIFMRWARAVGNVLMAYDEDQAIFAFQGAAPEWLMGLEGERQFLRQSHRVPRQVAAVAQRIIGRNRKRYPKTWDPKDEAGRVEFDAYLERVVRRAGNGERWFFMARNRYYLDSVCAVLREAGLPYVNHRGASPTPSAAVITALNLASGADASLSDLSALAEKTTAKDWWTRGAKAELERKAVAEPFGRAAVADLESLGALPGLAEALSSQVSCLRPLKVAEGNKSFFLQVFRRFGMQGLTTPPLHEVGTIHAFKGRGAPNVVVDSRMTRKTADSFDDDPEPERRVWYVAVSRTSRDLYLLDAEQGRAFDEW